MNNTYFVTGTDTDAGKTLATSALLCAARQRQLTAGLQPVRARLRGALADCGPEAARLAELDAVEMRQLKRMGFSDRRLAKLLGTQEEAVRSRRHQFDIRPVYKRVDTCAAETNQRSHATKISAKGQGSERSKLMGRFSASQYRIS